MLDLASKHLAEVRRILQFHVPGRNTFSGGQLPGLPPANFYPALQAENHCAPAGQWILARGRSGTATSGNGGTTNNAAPWRGVGYWSRVIKVKNRNSAVKTIVRIDALIRVAIQYIGKGAPPEQDGVIHRLAKFDTTFGLEPVKMIPAEQQKAPH
ncbi:MAG: hypothetical protein V1791_14940 [Pseudomonadota bacterium]